MKYQAIFSLYGDKIHVPVEAESREQATALAFEENPAMRKEGVKVRILLLADGEQAIDDRARLEFAPPPVRQGRPALYPDRKRTTVELSYGLLNALNALRGTTGMGAFIEDVLRRDPQIAARLSEQS